MSSVDSFLAEQVRAEDILLGGLGFDEDAHIVSVELRDDQFYAGTGIFSDGETFDFESDETATDLERWAVEIIQTHLNSKKVA